MNGSPTVGIRSLRRGVLSLLCSIVVAASAHGQWTAPSADELSMTSDPHVPGAPAIYLYREEITQDALHVFSIYVRMKILTEQGKRYGTIELPYATTSDGGGRSVEDITGRTIHKDGSIVPFTGKPMKKMVQKSDTIRFMTKVFSLPEVEVGSILEYRYNLRTGDKFFSAPDWYVQSELFTRKAYFKWKPTSETLVDRDDGDQLTSGISWFPVLPPGTALKQSRYQVPGHNEQAWLFELEANNVPPSPVEEQMPPIKSLSYRVLFFYTPYRTSDEYWKKKGRTWAKQADKFIGPGPAVNAEVQRLVLASDSPETKLKKLYAAVMLYDNTDFSREHTQTEERSDGLKQTRNTDDLVARKRGSSDQLTMLFIAMARSAGMKAYPIVISNRDERIFQPGYMNFGQLDDDLAIVVVDGKQRFFDPGQPYCPFGHLAWKHTLVSGLRQTDSGSDFVNTPSESHQADRVDRTAELKMSEQGEVNGKMIVRYEGAAALRWRQQSLTGDETSLNKNLEIAAEGLLPGGMEIKVASIGRLKEYEQPLTVTYEIKGAVGSSTGRRLMVPVDLFEANTKVSFAHEKRDTSVYFEYPFMTLDAIRFTLPATMSVESLPTPEKSTLLDRAYYELKTESTPTTVTVRRTFIMGAIVFPVLQYDSLRSFYTKLETKDQETIVLIRKP